MIEPRKMEMAIPAAEAADQVKGLQSNLDEANLRCKKLEESSAQSKRDQKKRVSKLEKKIAEIEAENKVLNESTSTSRQLTDDERTVIQQKKNLESVLALERQEVGQLSQYLQSAEEQLVLKESELAAMSERLAELEAKEDKTECLLREIKSLEEEAAALQEGRGNDTVGTKEAQYCKRLSQKNKEMEALKQQLALVKKEVPTLQQALRQRNSQNAELQAALTKDKALLRLKKKKLAAETTPQLSAPTSPNQLAERDRLESVILAQKEQLASYHVAFRERNSQISDLTLKLEAACSELTRVRDLVVLQDAELVALRDISSYADVLEEELAACQTRSRHGWMTAIGELEQQLADASEMERVGDYSGLSRPDESHSACRIA